MQETLKKANSTTAEPLERAVTLCLQTKHITLTGLWTWDMESPAVYASDVMHFPTDFEGTKGLIHPDDLPKLASALALLADGELAVLSFRLITTWGEVKSLHGEGVLLGEHPADDCLLKETREETLQGLAARREALVLRERSALADAAEKLHRLGSWAFNKSTGEAWYSDGVFRLHGLPPQSLNAHAHTFNPFLHPDDAATVIDTLETAYATEVPVHLDYRIVPTGGEPRTVRLLTFWSYNAKGQPLFSAVLRDITDEHHLAEKAEAAAQETKLSHQVVKFAELHGNTGHWVINLVTRKATYSDNCYRIYGLKQQQPSGSMAFINLLHADDRDRVKDLMDKMFREHVLPEAEFRILRLDGKMRYLKQSGKLFASGDSLLMIGTVQDVTVQKGLEKKIAELVEKTALQDALQAITENVTSLGFVTWQPDGGMTWSEGLYHLLGYKPGTLEPMPRLLHRQIHLEDLRAFKEAEQLAINGQSVPETRFRVVNKSGISYLSITFQHITTHNKELTVGVVQHITKELTLYRKLADATTYAETLNAAIGDMVLVTDLENTVLSWNRAAAEKTGVKADEAVYQNLFDLFPALNNTAYVQLLHEAVQGHERKEVKARDRYLKRPHHYYLFPLRSESGETIRIVHVVQDVSRELDLQQQLNERLNFIEGLVEASVDRIVVLDRHMNYLYWNKQAEDYYAISKSRVIGRNILEIFPGLRNDPNYIEFRKVLRGETVYLPPTPTDENPAYFETYLIPVKDEKGEVTAILWIVHDLSREYQLQQEQRKAQQRLVEEHRRLKEAQAIGHVGSFEWTAATNVIYWSDEMYRIHGLAPQTEKLTLERVTSFIHPEDRPAAHEKLEACRKKACTLSLQHRIIRTDGETRYVVRQIQSFADDNGKVIYLSGSLQDITEQKQSEEEIRQKSHYLQHILETGPDMVSIIELATMKTHYLNEETFAAHGFSTEYMAGRTRAELQDTIYADDRPVLGAYFKKFENAADEDVISAEYRAKGSHGEWRWFSVRGKVFQRNAEGKATHNLNVIEDITERKKAEQELLRMRDEAAQQATNRFEALVAAGNDAIYTMSADWTEMRSLKGMDFLPMNEQPVIDWVNIYIPEDERQRVMNAIDKAVRDKTVFELEHKVLHDNGETRWVFSRAVPLLDSRNEITEWFGAARDITKQKETEERIKNFAAALEQEVAQRTAALHRSTEELKGNFAILQQAEELSQMGSWEYNMATGDFFWSEGMYRLFGLPQGTKVKPDVYFDYAVEDDRKIARQLIKKLRSGEPAFEETLRITRGGDVRLLKIKGQVVEGENKEEKRVIGIDVDITDIKETQQKLEESRNLLEQTAQASPDAITVYDLQKKYPVYLNNCLAEWIGTTSEHLVTMGIDGRLELVYPDDRLHLLHFQEKLKTATDGQVLTLQYRLHKNDGALLWINNRSKIFRRDAAGKVTHILSVLQDVTEEKAAEQVLKNLNASLEKKNQELESKNEEITSFAFVASHDLKEPLRKIHTFSDWILTKEQNLSDTGRENLSRLINSVKRLDTLVEDILALSKVHAENEELAAVSLNFVLDRAMQEMKAEIKKAGAVIITDALPEVKGVENHLVYLFKNLLSNSIKFQQSGNKPEIKITASKDDSQINVSITDNGIGFAQEYRRKIFQMFRRLHSRTEFEGTGMGLAICKRIMERHGGSIKAESTQGEGAVFTCCFPLY